MKRLVLFSLIFLTFLSSCSKNIIIDETPDDYVDTLPSKTSEGPILQAFCWSHEDVKKMLPSIASAGYKSVQISPVQQPKSDASWWGFYQPLSLSIGSSILGNKETLTSLCSEAEKYDISIIVDTVFNHMANISDSDLESDGTPKVSPLVELYEPEIYANRNNSDETATFHHNVNASGSGAVTQVYSYGALPDLNTANSYVQSRCLSFLKECIDCGVDGFRFDAAKHIETNSDPSYASDFWENTLEVAKTYYKEKTGNDLYSYGEILNDPDGGRSIDLYTKYMSVTDNVYGSKVYSSIVSKKADEIVNQSYGKSAEATSLVTWVESHDTFADSSTSDMTFRRIFQTYSIVGSRSKTVPLYLARTDSSFTVGEIGSYDAFDERIAVINRFHNRFNTATEYQSAKDSYYILEKVEDSQSGFVIVTGNAKNYDTSVTLSLPHIENGVYYDQINGEKTQVVNHSATIKVGSDGVNVFTMSKDHIYPDVKVSSNGESFVNSKTITLSYTNVDSGYYTINGGSENTLTESITLGDVVDESNNIHLHIYLKSKNGLVKTRDLYFTKLTFLEGYESYFHVFNVKSDYLTNYKIYYWAWKSGSSGSYLDDFIIKDNIILIDFSKNGYTNFLLARFEKDHVVSSFTKWDSSCLSQTKDLAVSDKFFDASSW